MDKNIEQRQAKWRNFCQASGGKMFVVCDNRSCMRDIRSEINYCLGNKPLVVSLTNLADYRQENVEKRIAFGLKRVLVGSTDCR